ncbi:Cyclin, N-terminal domain containing protein [Tritrichomonas foetus]|uniref:Cyclin, N-terminal domain containing protein n=1 Tax=Tritrichomonas foetus TaxID=1144522 RepID=A0A1J4JSE8_9EUKA|nr:Cyclin, N-terminal domain containing protein [Tritrichomonas foetus]|eukprot:OHT01682.1 Cyclin, N-terminal domain containing protein [Tritrichomonas foetus]
MQFQTSITLNSRAQMWTEEKRRTVWFLISSARQNLGIAIDPVVASAFVILQKYFRGEIDDEYDLFILMAAALFTSCKASDNFRPVNCIVSELCRVCNRSKSPIVRQLIGSHFLNPEDPNITMQYNDLKLISAAEVDLLKANNFSVLVDLPFSHFERWKQSVIDHFPNQISPEFLRQCNKVMIDICLLICSYYYLDVPPEVAAAAAASKSFGNDQWVTSVKEKYGDNVFNLAVQSINIEDSKTVRKPPQRAPPANIIRPLAVVFV